MTAADGVWPRLTTARLLLSLPAPERADDVAAFYVRNREHLAPWDPPRPSGFRTAAHWHDQLARNRAEFAAGSSARFFLEEHEAPGAIVGSCSLSSIVRGAFQACNVGYALAADREGQGLMTEALRAVVRFAFDDLRLHRLQANHVPGNARSAAVLERLGFEREGLAREYLRIAGRWQDHVLTSLTNTDWRPLPEWAHLAAPAGE